MQVFQYFKIAAKSTNTVTLGQSPPNFPADARPDYLKNLSIVITTNLATADATFWSCGPVYRVEISRVT
jgi:hypothetical protein